MIKKLSFESLRGLKKSDRGLTDQEVESQRARFGVNEIVEVAGNPWLELAIDTLKDPMIWFLFGIGFVFLVTGNTSDAVTLFVSILPLVLMDVFLHWRTQSSTASLKGQLSSRVKVIRQSGGELEIDSRDLVPGDLIAVSSGLMLPADGLFESSTDLQIDESVLTGEALPVSKKPSTKDPFSHASDSEVSVDSESFGYAGTRVLVGSGLLRVIFTGSRTSYGEIVQSVARMPSERTPLQKSITFLVRRLIFAAGFFCLILAGLRVYQGYGWLDALISAATLAVAAIPEEFPVVFTFFLGVGVYRLAKKKALVRRAVSVENIGRITQICTDKTGTITTGRLQLTHIDAREGLTELDVLRVAFAASGSLGADPIDVAIEDFARERGLSVPNRIRTIPFTEDRKRETVLVKNEAGQLLAFSKGAPEMLFSLSNLSKQEIDFWSEKTSRWAAGGHKVLACAQRILAAAEVEKPEGIEEQFEFSGLIAFEDPPRPEVRGAMEYCRQNGIRVLMVTGDHPATAAAIAKDAGIGGSTIAVVSAEVDAEKFEDAWLDTNKDFLRNLDVVARCTPLQKLKIVTAFKRAGDFVAVTGDGVNDVPALKAADVGIAMGARGTRSAKEVSSIILSDDNFSTLTNAIMEGRQLFTNLRTSFEYLLLIHIPFVLTAALVPMFGFPLVYLPIHIVWLELVIHPSAMLAFQQAASLKSKVGRQEVLISRRDSFRIALLGFGLALVLGFRFVETFHENFGVEHARALALAMLTTWSASLVLTLTRMKNITATVIAVTTVLSSVVMIQTPQLAAFLHLSPLHLRDWGELILTVFAFAGADYFFRPDGFHFRKSA